MDNFRPANFFRRFFISRESDGLPATSNRNKTAVATLLTCCPPGPEARTKSILISRSSMAICGVIEIICDHSESLKEIPQVSAVRYTGYEHGVGTEYEIEARGEEDIREQVFRKAVEQNWVIIEMNRQKANLEEIFRRLTE